MAKTFFRLDSKLAFDNFFDRTKVINAMDRKTAAAMKHIGGFTRRTAKNSIKKSTSQTLHSPPGKPARTQTGILKRTIFFEYDDRKQTVIIGPKKLNITQTSKVKPTGGKTTVQLLEEGGTGRPTGPRFIPIRTRRRKRQKRKTVWRRLPDGPFNYRPRPTMRLAKKKSFTNEKLRYAFGVIGFKTR